MNTLIITAHPSSHGFTHKIANRYKKGAQEAGKKVEILDLYKTKWQQDNFAFENIREFDGGEAQKEIQKKITWADEMVFVFPLWWFSYPAVLKNFIDINFSSGFAFRYEKVGNKGKLQRLLKGKTARIFITCDGPGWFYKLIMTPKLSLQYGTLLFCGVKTKSYVIFDKMRFTKEEGREKRLQKVEKLGSAK